MAKPQSGNIFYNRTTDRPRVALRVGERDLLTTDDGSSPTGVAGGDLSGTYPNPTVEALGTSGTAVNVGAAAAPSAGQTLVATDATHATWQTVSGAPSGAAGGDLGGTYPNPTVEALGTTGTAVNVGATAPGTVGQVLTLTDATHATWQDGIQNLLNEYWCRDSSITYGALTEECTGSLNAGWSVKEWSTWTVPTNGGVVDSTSPPSANNYKITTNARRSWLMVHPAPSGTGVDLAVLLGSFTYASGGFQFRTRITSSIITDVTTTNGVSRLYICKNSAGNPDVSNNMFFGYANTMTGGNSQTIVVGDISGGGTTVRATYGVTQTAFVAQDDFELIVLGSGAVGTITVKCYLRGPTGTRFLGSASISANVGDTLRLVWRVTSTNSDTNIYAMDYFRQYPDLKITP